MAIGYGPKSGDGLTPQTPALSAMAIKIQNPNATDRDYWFVNPNVNSGTPFRAYCDMTTDGGGWMLIVQNASIGGATKMNHTNYSLHNQYTPPTASSRGNTFSSYSILAWADAMKNPSRPFEYMLEGVERGRWGGIWRANDPSYTFMQTTNTATDITLKTKFDNWNYNNDGIEERMPWVAAGATTSGKLTTSVSSSSSWWGTIIEASSSFSPAPWISGGVSGVSGTDNPGVIWYWMRGI